jgi:hypothetical protein
VSFVRVALKVVQNDEDVGGCEPGIDDMRFRLLTATAVKINVSWNMLPYSLVASCQIARHRIPGRL